jgi:hypothetical protein
MAHKSWVGKKVQGAIDYGREQLPGGMGQWTMLNNPATNMLNTIGGAFEAGIYNPLKHGRMGQYVGEDRYAGWDPDDPSDLREWAEKNAGRYLGDYKGGAKDFGYGLGESLEGVSDYAFDPTSASSLAEAMARGQFETDVMGQAEALDPGDRSHEIWDYSVYNQEKGQEEITEQSYADYWKDWYSDEKRGDYEAMAGQYTINPYEIGLLDPGHNKWRRMLNPLQQDVSEGYRGNIAGLQAGRGDIQSGGMRRRKQDALDILRENMFKARKQVGGARGQYGDTLSERVRKAFSTSV